MKISTFCISDSKAVTSVITPSMIEKPDPIEPFSKISSDSVSFIENMAVICPGENALVM